MSKGAIVLLRLGLWVIVVAYMVTSVVFYHTVSNNENRYESLKITILDSQKFVDETAVNLWLDTIVSAYKNHPLTEFPFADVEKTLRSNQYIETAEVFPDMEGHCVIKISQRDVIFRIISTAGHDFFVDTLGYRLNPAGAWQKRVPVITTDMKLPFAPDSFGDSSDDVNHYYLKNLHKFVDVLKNDTFLADLITQAMLTGDINPGSERLHLVPRVGGQRIVLGNMDKLERKLHNVSVFYKKTFHDGWWQDASEVCFQYGDKVVVKRL